MSESKISASIIYKIREEREKREEWQQVSPEKDPKINFYLTYKEFQHQNSCPEPDSAKAHQRERATPFPKMTQEHHSRKNNSQIAHPKKISLNFDLFNPKRRVKEQIHENSRSFQFEELMLLSKEKYLSKIEKQNRKRSQRCKLISMFGLNIRTMEKNEERGARKAQTKTKETITQENSTSNNNVGTAVRESKDEKKIATLMPTHKRSYNAREKSKSYIFDGGNIREQPTLKSKIHRMVKSNNILLYSFGCYIDQRLSDSNKCKYFVGNGNNKNLIISILKKRWWWTEANEASSASLVWTQLKHVSTIERLEVCSEERGNDINMQHFEEKFPEFSSEAAVKATSNFYHDKFSRRLQGLLSQKEKKVVMKHFKVPECVHNHFTHNFMLGNKNALFQNLTTYFEYKKEDVYSIIPLTFFVESVNSKRFEDFCQRAKNIKNAIWIVKPGENSNRGNGIFVSKNAQQIKRKLSRKKTTHTYIIQKYITNIFLYQRRKFDIRTYVLMLSIAGVTKFFWYNEGYLRTSSEIFDLNDLTDFFIHLTNDAIQINNNNYGKYEDGNKITYNEFQRYLDNNHSQEKYKVKELNEEMKKIATTTIKATYGKIDPQKKTYGFQLFGLDFIVDSSFKPWLLEVNTNPCLELTSPTLQRLIPRMLENLFRIAIDPIYQPSEEISKSKSYYVYENSLDKNKFELIFDTLFDRDFQWQQHVKKEQQKVYEDDNQIFEGDGQEMATQY